MLRKLFEFALRYSAAVYPVAARERRGGLHLVVVLSISVARGMHI